MLGLASIPGAIQFLGFWFLPESPRWLVKHGRVVKAKETLQRLVGDAEAEKEFAEIVQAEEEQHSKSMYFCSYCALFPDTIAFGSGGGVSVLKQTFKNKGQKGMA